MGTSKTVTKLFSLWVHQKSEIGNNTKHTVYVPMSSGVLTVAIPKGSAKIFGVASMKELVCKCSSFENNQ